jgi:hypothetical protein
VLTVWIRRWLAVAAALTLIAILLHVLPAGTTGLERTVYPAPTFAGDPLSRVQTSDVGLGFLEETVELRRRPFSVRWEGAWFFPQQREIELRVTARGRAEVRVDGGLLVRHPARDGVRTVWSGIIGRGPHALTIEYEGAGADGGLSLSWAPGGAAHRPLDADMLLPAQSGASDYWTARLRAWLTSAAVLFWFGLAAVAVARRVPATVAAAIRKGHQAFRQLRSRGPGIFVDLFHRWRRTSPPQSVRELGQRLALVTPAALLGPVVLFLVGPHTLYSANQSEFNTTFGPLLPRLLAGVAISSSLLVLAGLGCALVSRRLLRLYVAVLFAAGLLVWVQGTLLVGHYGLLTGEALDLRREAWREPYELALWIGGLGGAAVFARRVSSIAPRLSLLLVGLQGLALVLAPIAPAGQALDREAVELRAWQAPPPEIYRLSSDRNVIHIVLDGFLSATFGDIAAKEPGGIGRSFEGFVFFADHLGAFRTTRASMPAMLTGLAYRNERPFVDFEREVLERGSLFGVLAGHGFRVHSMTFHPWEHPPASLGRDQVVRYSIPTPYASYGEYVEFATAQLVDLSLFRHVPHRLKPAVYGEGRWLLQNRYDAAGAARRSRPSNHAAFLDQFASRLTVGETRPVYTFMHLLIPHLPIVLDEDCSFIPRGRAMSRDAYTAQARCGVRLVERLLDRLRELGVYDRSTIVLTSDHGWLVPGLSPDLAEVRAPGDRLDLIAHHAMPLLAIKPPGGTGLLRISQAPTTITDIPATVLDLLGLPPVAPGEPVFRLDEHAGRPRVFAHYPWGDGGWEHPYFEVLWLFSVEGRVTDPAAWRFRKAIFPAGEAFSGELERRQSGFQPESRGPDGAFRWSEPYAVTYAPLEARALVMEVRTAPGIATQTLAVRVDGGDETRYRLDETWLTLRHELPRPAAGANAYTIELLVDPPDTSGDQLRGAPFRSVTWTR